MNPRLKKRLQAEISQLEKNGCVVSFSDSVVTVKFVAKQPKTSKVLLGIYKYRKSLFDIIGKNIVTDYIARMCLTREYSIKIDLHDNWPFRAPLVSMNDYNSSEYVRWTPDNSLWDIVDAFKKQLRFLETCGKPNGGLLFYFYPKRL